MMAKKIFTSQEMEILRQNPNVKHVRESRLTLTYEFRNLLWETWDEGNSINHTFESNGFDTNILGSQYINSIKLTFKRYGRPSGGKNKELGENLAIRKNTNKEIQTLLSSGLFIKICKGIGFHPDFVQELFHNYPNESIEDGLLRHDIDPVIVGYPRIYALKRMFDGEDGYHSVSQSFDEATIKVLNEHPYVKRITKKQFVLYVYFYDDASKFKELHIDQILKIFEIDYKILPVMTKYRILHRLRHHKASDSSSICTEDTSCLIRIEQNKQEAMSELIERNFRICKECVPYLSKQKRKALCQLIQQFPQDDKNEFTIRSILAKVAISKTSYYAILSDDNYGRYEAKQDKQDRQDIAMIQKVADYKGYPKGSRLITMMMPGICNMSFSRGKVLRLMRKGNIRCEVRKANENKRAAKEQLERNVKENKMKRQFRFERPMMRILTDVSYLFYGNHEKAYLSCLKDASSGRVLGYHISEHNNEQLADRTLDELRNYKLPEGTMIHSDQGILYLSKHFQQQVQEMNMIQSMSRRGNCWDNAPQESFFGHFKDEVHYQDCANVNEIDKKLKDYIKYYNEERPQWTRMKMTPNEFETYLNQMNKEEFDHYQDKEKKKYEVMMKNACIKAKKRARDIGVEVKDMVY